MHNFVSRDGTPPEQFRQLGREQLAAYPNVEIQDVGIEAISGSRGTFQARLTSGVVEARRVLLCTGLVDEMLPIEGFRELWGRGIFQCPYCHGWEIQDRRWGYLARAANVQHMLPFSIMLRGWSRDVTVFTGGALEVAQETRDRLAAAGVRLETAPITRLVARDRQLESVELATGAVVSCEGLFVHPPQYQVALVRELGVALDDDGFVRIDPMTRETSIPGIYAAGDLTTRLQAAIIAAAAGMQAAAAINVELTMELATSGALS
jgi:thioredoxin reductase